MLVLDFGSAEESQMSHNNEMNDKESFHNTFVYPDTHKKKTNNTIEY